MSNWSSHWVGSFGSSVAAMKSLTIVPTVPGMFVATSYVLVHRCWPLAPGGRDVPPLPPRPPPPPPPLSLPPVSPPSSPAGVDGDDAQPVTRLPRAKNEKSEAEPRGLAMVFIGCRPVVQRMCHEGHDG